jgi:hypothetical protein
MRKGEELKTPRHASAAASRDDRLPHSRQVVYIIAWIKLLIKGSSARRKISRGGVNKVIKFILNRIKN